MAENVEPTEDFQIRVAINTDIPQLRDLEVQAAQLFREKPALASFADSGPSLSVQRQEELIERGTMWVTVPRSPAVQSTVGKACAFLAADVVDDSLHIFELSTSPEYQRRGCARLLLEAAAKHANTQGLESLSLTTDRYISWNGPMYRKRGFVEIEPFKLGPAHVKIVDVEVAEGLDVSRRYTMVYHLKKP